ncbi:hypothetical protein PYW08_005931 [Mythimna loreyi]|uniref:Uncharacterized protein n=1 Tax=Mythimna loreyi TaxID=667449 RepID=A0ACC2QJ18_9NEOP|nr:hypothetical protein PYW08_005931 [Mythimna loreyi]
MAGARPLGPAAGAAPADEVFLKYYTGKDYSTSLEGVLKMLSAIVSVVSAVLFLGWSACLRSPGLAAAAAGSALAGGAASALLFGGVVLGLPLRAPQFYLLTDIIVSTVAGLLLLVTAVLNITVCEFYSVVSYLHGPLAVLNAGMVIASAVITYVGVMRLWDAAHPPPPPAELDV